MFFVRGLFCFFVLILIMLGFFDQANSSKLDPIVNYHYNEDYCNVTNTHNQKIVTNKKLNPIFVSIISQMDNDNNSKKAFVTLLYDKDTTVLQYLEI